MTNPERLDEPTIFNNSLTRLGTTFEKAKQAGDEVEAARIATDVAWIEALQLAEFDLTEILSIWYLKEGVVRDMVKESAEEVREP